MLAHAQIVVGAPDGDFPFPASVVGGPGKLPGLALEIGEHPVTAFGTQCVEFRFEEIFVIHIVLSGALPAVHLHGVRLVSRAV
jgi:hypothetical protein